VPLEELREAARASDAARAAGAAAAAAAAASAASAPPAGANAAAAPPLPPPPPPSDGVCLHDALEAALFRRQVSALRSWREWHCWAPLSIMRSQCVPPKSPNAHPLTHFTHSLCSLTHARACADAQ
jgi:hypothetical protein